jgi:Chromosome segregation protein Spc25
VSPSRFSFSQIDPEDPSRKFWFVLGANEFDVYNVDECSPAIEQSLLQGLLHDLNVDDDLGQFVMKMRLEFVQTL